MVEIIKQTSLATHIDVRAPRSRSSSYSAYNGCSMRWHSRTRILDDCMGRALQQGWPSRAESWSSASRFGDSAKTSASRLCDSGDSALSNLVVRAPYPGAGGPGRVMVRAVTYPAGAAFRFAGMRARRAGDALAAEASTRRHAQHATIPSCSPHGIDQSWWSDGPCRV